MKIQLYKIFVLFKYGKYLHTSCLIRIYIDLFSSNCVQSVDGYKKNIRKIKPLDRSDNMWNPTEVLPALSPKIVTRFGSPPNAAMLFCTHWKTNRWSFKPAFPVAFGCFNARNPDDRMEYLNQSFLKWMNEYVPRTPSR